VFERPRSSEPFVALLHHTQRYASVARGSKAGVSTLSVRQAVYEAEH